MKHEARPDWRPALLGASALVFLAATHQAHGECLSPSAPAGATSTTVYRCPDTDPAQAKQPALGNREKTTVVERGSADLPWFEPQTAGKKVDAAKLPAAKMIEPASAPDKPVDTVDKPVETLKVPKKIEMTSAPDKPVETVKVPKKIETASAPEPDETAKVKKKATGKKKFAGRKRVKKARIATTKAPKVKVAKKTPDVKTARIATTKAPKVKVAKTTPDVKTVEETPKIESKPADEKTIVWTKKDMPLGSRIKTWLGF